MYCAIGLPSSLFDHPFCLVSSSATVSCLPPPTHVMDTCDGGYEKLYEDALEEYDEPTERLKFNGTIPSFVRGKFVHFEDRGGA